MFTVTFNRETEIFESENSAEAVKFFEMCKRDIAADFDKEKRTAGKSFDKSYVMSYELWEDSEDDYMSACLDEAIYSMGDWERDND